MQILNQIGYFLLISLDKFCKFKVTHILSSHFGFSHTRSTFYGGNKDPMEQTQESVVKSPSSTTGTPQRLVYCVHGRPNDCCVSVINNQNNASTPVSTIICESCLIQVFTSSIPALCARKCFLIVAGVPFGLKNK